MKKESINPSPETVFSWNINLSNHSQARSQQRGISRELLFLALDYSVAIFKQGLIFYAVIDKLIPEKMDHHMREKLNNLIVVVSPDMNEIITCYRSADGVHHLKRKSKQLH